MTNKIKVGDLVFLNGNSQVKMTVSSTSGLFMVECSFFDHNNVLQKEMFNRNSLTLVTEDGNLGQNNESLLLG